MTARLFPLASLRTLAVTGPDARSFLQNQLSSDLNEVTDSRGQFSAWHDPKGRVLTFLRLLPWPDGFLLVLHASLAESIDRRMRMYVLRARVTVSGGPPVFGLLAHSDAAPGNAVPLPALPTDELAAAGDGRVVVLRLPGEERWLVAGELGEPAERIATDEAQAVAAWELAEVAAGIPEIYPETSGQFVAQMLNLDRMGAVSFTKGCYPGQEIVARAHHLGRVKRRARLFTADGPPPAPGASLTESGGTVLRAASNGAGCLVLAVVGDEAPGPFTLADGRKLSGVS
jgi:tRNA-modifying protein YgfZ